jgi:predicted dienelactone hydrolase
MRRAAAATGYHAAMPYDPFARGSHPVGVRTVEIDDSARGRRVPLEIWYPAHERHAGEDLDDATRDRFQVIPMMPETQQDAVRDAAPAEGPEPPPAVVFSHGFAGHRRQSTFLCTHLASHGYVVAAPDHVGNTTADMMALIPQLMAAANDPSAAPDAAEMLGGATDYRRSDASLAVDVLIESGADPERVGISGHSFGGWTCVAAAGADPRLRAVLPLAPAGGAPVREGDPLPGLLNLEWERDAPTFYLAAERDSLLPLDGMHALYERTKATKRLAVLRNADHQHFADDAERTHEFIRMLSGMAPEAIRAELATLPPFAELAPADHGYHFTRSAGLAHFDAHLRRLEEALEFLEAGLAAALAERGIEVDWHG